MDATLKKTAIADHQCPDGSELGPQRHRRGLKTRLAHTRVQTTSLQYGRRLHAELTTVYRSLGQTRP